MGGKLGPIDSREANCETHGAYVSQLLRIPDGREIWTKCPECDKAEQARKDRERASAMEAERRERIITNALKQAAIPPRFLGRTLDSYEAKTAEQAAALSAATQYAEAFGEALETGRSMVFCGSPGTGKTHLATGIAQQVIAHGRTAAFTTTMNAIRRIRDTYRKASNETESDAIRSFTVPDLLILDEVGTQRGTDDEKVLLFDIINARYEAIRPMIVISNLDLKGVREYLGERAFDRLREGGGRAVQFTWSSHRRDA
jgi:DNA replication protein DnaC